MGNKLFYACCNYQQFFPHGWTVTSWWISYHIFQLLIVDRLWQAVAFLISTSEQNSMSACLELESIQNVQHNIKTKDCSFLVFYSKNNLIFALLFYVK